MKAVQIEDIQRAREAIRDTIFKTPLTHSRSASQNLSTQVYFKFENEQMTGSFKIRGALNKILALPPETLAKGIVASSAGNHAQGVALAASRVGTQAHIVMPTTSPLVKIMATQGYGAEVILHGAIYDDAYQHARELEKQKDYTFVHAFEDPLVIAGQGTIGLEIIDEIPDVVPIGGGGLISGVATAIKALRPQTKIYGVVSTQVPGMMELFKKIKPNEHPPGGTIADGIAVKKPSEVMYSTYISHLVDDVVAVSDDEIAEAIVWLLERTKSVVEGSGATVLAAALKAQWNLGKKTCLLLSGGNIDLNIISMVIERGLSPSPARE